MIIDTNELWNSALSSLEKSLSKPIFETILSSTRPITVEEGVFLVAVPNVFSRDWLYEKKCDATILSSLKTAGNGHIKTIKFIVLPLSLEEEEREKKESRPAPTSSTPVGSSFLNPRYTFDNFVVGHGNRFAHAAALAVSESPGKAYNPLFLYGGVGLGKTHLMQAIGHHVFRVNPRAKVVYMTSEKFTNEVIDSIQHNTMGQFRNKYRGVDILMIDDIQFIAGKERTMEEFFHTFNTLYESSKQIIISNDRPPKEIEDIDDRLRTRFEWGLLADIQPPDFETRIAILKKKAELEEISVPDDVFSLIATKVSTNIRELEGALIRLIAHGSIENREITKDVAEELLRDFLSPSRGKPPISIDLIKKVTSEYYSLKIDEMSSKTRTKEIATARQIAMYLCRELTSASLPKIGGAFGGRDHTTVMHACDKIKTLVKEDEEVADSLNTITKKIRAMGA